MEFKKGDRVTGNSKNPAYSRRTGTVSYVSGTDCWVKFDGSDNVEGGIHSWYLEPLVTEASRAQSAA